ncbi:SUR7/PalI family protein [Candida parapsilosis]|uniref:PH-response regulator protein palI/RIM9 n=2 Tax=Candida parapsilosis TaxID=5480 RepID=G8BE51_CANPC|nr:uncharacterized protein CPAR2_211920 [Candida parapsilosis]KAF6054303.1 SUR7/PalI family protein [Candida parapsilosis]KAF6056673.1 SUR7/PalI family protein [Candida parapsilosis]KAF6059608.1 SUR7/PalI family protein [Candida parapsilosis]KAF6068361.1 SUR7/PalI family protein [Candida parapsilosis]CCE43548.1 hypothetical protein CPAR2_211920 [Candida parapsilosis]
MGFRFSFNTGSLILILVSFVFLLLATISSPVVTTFNLGKTADYTYGVFGYCTDNNKDCSSATYPLTLSSVDDSSTNWTMGGSTRDTLAKIFILTPIALGFNFILLVLVIASHFGNRAIVLIALGVNIISAILTIISCVVTILAFYPNLAWTGWILIGSAAANLISIILLILTLTTLRNDEDDDEDDAEGNDKHGFGTFNNYNKIDDKFNHIQTSTFKSPNSTSSIDNDYDYKPSYNGTNTSFGTPANHGASDTRYNGHAAIAAASAASLANSNGGGVPAHRTATGTGSFTSNSSSAYQMKPQTANDFTHMGNRNNTSGSLAGGNAAGYKPINASGVPYPTTPGAANNNAITNNNGNAAFSRSVFEHHPQVDGHRPFTEMDDDFDDEEDLNAGRTNVIVTTNDSDEDSDFTSVSQRPPNPQYNNQYGPIPQQHYQNTPYANSQQYQPLSQQMNSQSVSTQGHLHPSYQPIPNQYGPPAPQPPPPQQQQTYRPMNYPQPQPQQPGYSRPTISDNVLSNNPDFNFARGMAQQKKKVAPGFVPVAARYGNNNRGAPNNASALMGRNGAGSTGTQARSGPYGLTR